MPAHARASRAAPTPAPVAARPAPRPAAPLPLAAGRDFAGLPLRVGRADDAREAEADRAARQAMAGAPVTLAGSAPPLLQRACCAACEEQDTLRASPNGAGLAAVAPPAVHRVLAAPGRAPSAATLAFFNPRFGRDFSAVRLHDDAAAGASARAVGARAYAVGRHVVVDGAAESPAARPLLAHELAHVVQQQGAAPVLARQPVDAGRSPDEDRMLNCIVETQRTPAGVISDQEAFAACKEKWHWTGPDLAPTADDRRQINTGEVISADDIAAYREALARYLQWRQAGTVPLDLQQWVDPQIDLTQRLLAPYMPAAMQAVPEAQRKAELVARLKPDSGGGPGVAQAGMPAAALLAAQRAAALARSTALSRAALRWGVAEMVPLAEGAGVATTGTGVATVAATGTEVAAVTTGAEVAGGTAAAGAAAPVAVGVLAVAALVLAGYLSWRFWRWLETPRIMPTYPQLPDAVRETINRINRTGEHLVPVTPVPIPKPKPKPEPEEKKKRRCPHPTGLTPDDPIPITWFKPRHDSFYPRRIAIQDGVLDRDDPNAKLPDGTRIGVRAQHWPACNKLLQLVPTGRDPRVVRDYKAALARFGYDWRRMQPDHVQDLFWEGPDEFRNLWPYEASTNMSTGSTQNSHQFVSFCLSKDGPAYANQRISWNRAFLNTRYFIIKRYALHSGAADFITCP